MESNDFLIIELIRGNKLFYNNNTEQGMLMSNSPPVTPLKPREQVTSGEWLLRIRQIFAECSSQELRSYKLCRPFMEQMG